MRIKGRGRLPAVIRVGRAVYRRYPRPEIITVKEEEYIKRGLELLLDTIPDDDLEDLHFVGELIRDFAPVDQK